MPNDTPPDGKLADLKESGKPASNRVTSPDHALEICKSFVNEDRERASRRLKVQGAFNGNAPKSAADMMRAGRSGDSNLNFKRHRGMIMNAWTPFFDLVCEVPVCINGDLEFGDANQDVELMNGFAGFFHDLLFNHTRGFDDMSQLCDLQMLLHGPGILAWEDEWNYCPKAILAGRFYVPPETNTSLDNCEMAMVASGMTAGQLWRKISGATHPGWSVEAVKRAIMDSATSESGMREWQWDRWEQAFKNGDLYISQRKTKLIQVFTLFVEEMDGRISQKIVPVTPGGSKGVEFLFDSTARYESWDQVVCLFPYDIGADGTYHSVKGLGTDIYPFCALLNSIDNSTADLVVSGIKPMWQPTTNAKMEEFKMAKWGGGNFVPNGINPLQIDISRGIAPALEVSRRFAQTMSGNTAAANANDDYAAPTVEETAKSAMIRAAERDKAAKGLRNRYMRAKSRQYAEMWRRAVNPKLRSYHPGAKEALKFQERCYALCDKLGVPHGALQAVTNIRAAHSIGNGSPAMRYEIANTFMANIDRFDEQGQNQILRMFTSVLTSYHDIDAYVPSLTVGRNDTADESFATLENDALNVGGEAMVVPSQNHFLHLNVHIGSMESDAQLCQQGQQEPRDCATRLTAKGAHSAIHLEALARNPLRKRDAKQFEERLKALNQFLAELQQVIEQEDAAAAEQPQPGEVTPEMAKVQGSLEIKAQKEQATMALRAQKQEFDQQLRAQNAEFERRLKDLEMAANLNRKTTEHRVDTGMAMDEHRREQLKNENQNDTE